MMKKIAVKLIVALFLILFIVSLLTSFFLGILLRASGESITLTREMLFVLVMVIAVIILTAFAFATNYLVIRRINKLIAATKIIAKGNFDFDINDYFDDELSELTANFNLMIQALQSNEYLSKEFINNVSHEFKTPITSLKGYAKLLQKDNITTDERKEYCEIILNETERLHKLSNDLLQLSALDSPNIIRQTDCFRLDEQIKRIILLMQNEWESKNIEMIVDLDPINYRGSEELLYLVWLNLISNAIKYTDENGKIEIKLNEETNIMFKIKDNGVGIKKEYHDKIFEQFFVGDKSRNQGSSGLGLPITKKIIDKLKGNISFTSTEGVGTEFVVLLTKTD
ncbi:MAG: HAMP domain-containing histidine kinase [Clostridiales bacterium]|jgi:signal transduction histidine kinase|nr:HAMP domain-containing histidine kinase [Clostridiales bacterium]